MTTHDEGRRMEDDAGVKPIDITDDLLEKLFVEQLKCAKEHAEMWIGGYRSDDGYDYLTSALELAQLMADIYYDRDTERLGLLLNTPEGFDDADARKEELGMEPLAHYACDGVANAFYELKPPSLKEMV